MKNELPLDFNDLTDEEKLLEYVSKLTYIVELLRKYKEIQNLYYKLINIDKITYEKTSWIAANMKKDLKELANYFNSMDVLINFNECYIRYVFDNKYTVNGLDYLYRYREETSMYSATKSETTIEESMYIVEKCANCVNWNSEGGLHKMPPNYHLRYISNTQDINGKGGFGLWEYDENHSYKKIELTDDLKREYLQCKYAFSVAPMVSRGSILCKVCEVIEDTRKIPINILRMAQNSYKHCKKFTPKKDCVDTNKLLQVITYANNITKITTLESDC